VPLSYGLADAIGAELRVSVADVVEAGILDRSAADALLPAEREADLFGMTTYYMRNQDMSDSETVTHLSRLRFMIGSGDIIGAMREAPSLAPYMQHLLGDANAAKDFDRFANGPLSDAINLAELESEQVRIAAEEAAVELALTWEQDRENAAFVTQRRFRDLPRAALIPATREIVEQINQLRSGIPGERDEARREEMQTRVQSLIASARDGLFDNLVSDMPNQEEVDRLRAAFATGNVDLLSARELSVYRSVELLSEFDQGIFDSINSDFGTYREGGGRFAQRQDEEQAEQFVSEQILPLTNDFVNLRGDNIAALRESLLSAVDSAPTMTDSVRRSATNAININSAQAELYQAFEMARSEQETLALRLYAETGQGAENLPPRAIMAIDRAREATAATGNTSALPTAISRAVESANRNIAADRRQREEVRGVENVLMGVSNPRSQADREYADLALDRAWRRVTGEPLPVDLFNNPEYLQNPQTAQIISDFYSIPNAMPETAYNLFSSIGSGTIVPNMETAVAHWSTIRSTPQVRNPAINALTEDQIGTMDMLSEAAAYFGTDENGRVNYAEAIRAHNQLRHSEAFNAQAEVYLEQPINDFVASLDGYDTLQDDQRQGIRALASSLISYSISTAQGNKDWLRTRLETQINEATPDTGEEVMEFGPNGQLSSRSRYALQNTIPNHEGDFIEYVREEVSRLSDGPTVFSRDFNLSFAERFVGPLGRDVDLSTSQYSVLVPFGEDNMGGTSYYVYQRNLETGEFGPVMRNDEPGLPLIVSTAEQRFRWRVALDERRNMLTEIERGNAYRELFGEGLYRSGEGLELMGLPPEMQEAR
jgi:hypothetical protein